MQGVNKHGRPIPSKTQPHTPGGSTVLGQGCHVPLHRAKKEISSVPACPAPWATSSGNPKLGEDGVLCHSKEKPCRQIPGCVFLPPWSPDSLDCYPECPGEAQGRGTGRSPETEQRLLQGRQQDAEGRHPERSLTPAHLRWGMAWCPTGFSCHLKVDSCGKQGVQCEILFQNPPGHNGSTASRDMWAFRSSKSIICLVPIPASPSPLSVIPISNLNSSCCHSSSFPPVLPFLERKNSSWPASRVGASMCF